MTRDLWVEAHSYLRPVAVLSAEVDRAASAIAAPDPRIPDWENYRADFLVGVPLLLSASAAVDLEPGARMARELVERLASGLSSETHAGEARALETELRGAPDVPRRIADFLLGGQRLTASPGLLRYVGWTAMARFLRPVVQAFAAWRDEERWLRNYCPTCGSPPAMGQLVGKDPGRLRMLSCGACRTQWQFRRTGCPFCDVQDKHRLSVVAVDGERGLRIDYCEACRGYLKTYDGQGSEDVLLADWTSLHLDVLAADRGLKRLAASLYDL